jgi:predicted ArsR family transcriptional regulator
VDRTVTTQLDRLSPLAEPVRRELYLHVIAQPEPVGRDAAAAAVGIGRSLAAFHLDRLVDAGLLTADYRRLTGRTGPGAGRPAKVYLRADEPLEVTVPARREAVMAGLLATAIEGAHGRGRDIPGALAETARTHGRELGHEARRRAGSRPSRRRLLDAVIDVLDESGFEPSSDGAVITLRNCPFDRVARDHRDLVCGANRSIMAGLVDGLKVAGVTTTFDPSPGRCCVRLSD